MRKMPALFDTTSGVSAPAVDVLPSLLVQLRKRLRQQLVLALKARDRVWNIDRLCPIDCYTAYAENTPAMVTAVSNHDSDSDLAFPYSDIARA